MMNEELSQTAASSLVATLLVLLLRCYPPVYLFINHFASLIPKLTAAPLYPHPAHPTQLMLQIHWHF